MPSERKHKDLSVLLCIQAIYVCTTSAILLFEILLTLYDPVLPQFLKSIQTWQIAHWTTLPSQVQYILSLSPWWGAIFLFVAEALLHRSPWETKKQSYAWYCCTEHLIRLTRIIIYISAFVMLYFVYSDNTMKLQQNKIFSHSCVVIALPLLMALIRSMRLLNFRRWSNYLLAGADVLVFLAILDMLWFKSYNETYAFFLNKDNWRIFQEQHKTIHPIIQGTIILTPFVAFLKDAITNAIGNLNGPNASDLPEHRRKTRCRLLTHAYFRGNSIAFDLDNTLVLLLFIHIILYAAAVLTALNNPMVFTVDEAGSPPVQYQLSTHSYILFIAVVIAATSFVSFWSISDEHMISNEYLYLKTKGANLTAKDMTHSTSRWIDFCQVMINLYSFGSGLESENRKYHDLKDMLCSVQKHVADKNYCAGVRFVSELLSMKGDRNAALRRESHLNTDGNALSDKDNVVRIAQDLQFAQDMLALTETASRRGAPDFAAANNKAEILTCQNPLTFIQYLTDSFFGSDSSKWNQWFHTHNVDVQEGIALLKMDSILHILQRERSTKDSCSVKWLGCYCNTQCQDYQDRDHSDCSQCPNLIKRKTCSCKDTHRSHSKISREIYQKNRMELLMLYPFLVVEFYKARWSAPANISSFLPHFESYYNKLFDDRLYINNSHILPDFVEQVLNSLITNDYELKWVSLIGGKMEAKHNIPLNASPLEKARNDRFCQTNASRKKDMDDNMLRLIRLSYYYTEVAVPEKYLDNPLLSITINNLYRLTYSIFRNPDSKN